MFTPLRFQSALAAGGVALMPFVLMQFTFAHTDTLVYLKFIGVIKTSAHRKPFDFH